MARYKSPTLTLREQTDAALHTSRVVTEGRASPFQLSERASRASREAVQKLGRMQADPCRILWLALFGLDSDLDEQDPRGPLVFTKDVGFYSGTLRSRGRKARQQLLDHWAKLSTKLNQLAKEAQGLEFGTRSVFIDRDVDRENMMIDLTDALLQFAEWVDKLRPLPERGAPRRSDFDYAWRRTAVVMYVLRREGMKPSALRELVEQSMHDWDPVPPIRVSEARRMVRRKQWLRDRISLLVREGKRRVEGQAREK